jgi:hypothetical protein
LKWSIAWRRVVLKEGGVKEKGEGKGREREREKERERERERKNEQEKKKEVRTPEKKTSLSFLT